MATPLVSDIHDTIHRASVVVENGRIEIIFDMAASVTTRMSLMDRVAEGHELRTLT
jgi:hypothetical protein